MSEPGHYTMTVPECETCKGTGWILVDNVTGDPWDIPCPENCPAAALPDDWEVPY